MTELTFAERRFGYEQIKRREDIKRLSDDSQQIHTEYFQNENTVMKVVRLPIELPMYRLANGRTLSFQIEYIAKHQKDPDFFRRDLNSIEAQTAQHTILETLAQNKGLFKHFEIADNKQTELIICTNDGFIVNGNRRMACWRTLYYEDSNKYKHLKYINAAILPECDEDAIEELEHKLQIAPDMKDPYCWHAEATRMKYLRDERGFDYKKIADIYAQYSAKDISERIQMLDYAAQYLDRIQKKDLWSEVTDKEYAFNELVSKRELISNPEDKILFQTLAFAMITQSQEGRLYGKIPDIKKYYTAIFDTLKDEFSSQIKNDKNDDQSTQLTLLGIIPNESEVSPSAIASFISTPEIENQVVKICEDVIDTQKALEKEDKDANYLVEQVRKANTLLRNAITAYQARTDLITNGLKEQIAAIEHSLSQLKEWQE